MEAPISNLNSAWHRRSAAAIIRLACLIFSTTAAFAGNGPHNWLVDYDPADLDGVAIARHIAHAEELIAVPHGDTTRATLRFPLATTPRFFSIKVTAA